MIGQKLKQLRKTKGIYQRQLAEATGCSEKAISSYERDFREPSLETLKKFANYFQVSIDFFADNEQNVTKIDPSHKIILDKIYKLLIDQGLIEKNELLVNEKINYLEHVLSKAIELAKLTTK